MIIHSHNNTHINTWKHVVWGDSRSITRNKLPYLSGHSPFMWDLSRGHKLIMYSPHLIYRLSALLMFEQYTHVDILPTCSKTFIIVRLMLKWPWYHLSTPNVAAWFSKNIKLMLIDLLHLTQTCNKNTWYLSYCLRVEHNNWAICLKKGKSFIYIFLTQVTSLCFNYNVIV